MNQGIMAEKKTEIIFEKEILDSVANDVLKNVRLNKGIYNLDGNSYHLIIFVSLRVLYPA